jgi:hypothetical protein
VFDINLKKEIYERHVLLQGETQGLVKSLYLLSGTLMISRLRKFLLRFADKNCKNRI